MVDFPAERDRPEERRAATRENLPADYAERVLEATDVDENSRRVLEAAVEEFLREETDLETAEKLGELEANLVGIDIAINRARNLRDDTCKELGLLARDISDSEADPYARFDKYEERLFVKKRAELAEVVEEIRAVDSRLGANREPDTFHETARRNEPRDPQEKLAHFHSQFEVAKTELASREAEYQVMQNELERNRGFRNAPGPTGLNWKVDQEIRYGKTKLDHTQESIDIAHMVYSDLQRELTTGEHFPSTPMKPDEAKAFFLRQIHWPEQLRAPSYVNSRLLGSHVDFWLENEFEHYLNPQLPEYRTDLLEYPERKVKIGDVSRTGREPAFAFPQYRLDRPEYRDIPLDVTKDDRDSAVFWVEHGESFVMGNATWRITKSFFRETKSSPRLHVDLERVRSA